MVLVIGFTIRKGMDCGIVMVWRHIQAITPGESYSAPNNYGILLLESALSTWEWAQGSHVVDLENNGGDLC